MFKEKVPMKIVVPIIVVTWILSLISALAIVYMVPSLIGIRSEQIGEGMITSDKIADGAIITVKLADGNVTSAKILDGNITAVDIADGSIITVKVSDGAVTTGKIADGAVTTNKIADGNVTEAKIADDAIVTIKLRDGSVTSAKILDGNITALDLADNSVITAKIEDGAVTTEKIADYAVTNLKLAANVIPFNSTSNTTYTSTTSWISYVDMPGMSVNLNVTRNSTLIIIFSAVAQVNVTENLIYVRANVTRDSVSVPVIPSWIYFMESTEAGSFSFTFYIPNVIAGTYRAKIEWEVQYGTMGEVWQRTLLVMALPK